MTGMAAVLFILCLIWLMPLPAVQVSARTDQNEFIKFYFDIGQGINEEDSVTQTEKDGFSLFKINPDFFKATAVRIDFEGLTGAQVLGDITFYSGGFAKDDLKIGALTAEDLAQASEINDIQNVTVESDGLHFEISGGDPYAGVVGLGEHVLHVRLVHAIDETLLFLVVVE